MIYKITLTDTNVAQVFISIPEGVTTLDLSNNFLGSKSYSDLLKIADSMPPGVTSLDLSSNGLGLTHVSFVTPQHVTSLNLCFNPLHKISLSCLEWLKDSFAHIQTISLSYDTVNSMSREQRQALRAVFPNIQTITLVDKNGKEIDPSHSAKISNLIRELGGGNPEVPSLLNQCAFFVKNQGININTNIPEELKERIHNCNPL
ncbi:hypothetical protein [Legionella pneumophila]|uniref:Leucine-rich repeat-containing protein n=1 Tax=Legionella pneumophila subsp. pascullei TaxID=91890 RepID=A0AAX2IY13_LEGPN|nr:hypothetical protein [Legionella pneumophila]AMP89431.1 hypothetical protein AXF35_06950 [Legionella pneumophila subsp. pascullei]AMP92903.1 hypothetical protein AXF36_09850 [Legionella pneumophila subsp. pascullei]AMP95869.1 hypothetical protein AXF37_09740 [Legionella pneumophila subsp. pascullei]SQG90788.1 leucine-rich repeat-containing protein [Legionella pneumophila subsp. pascullei]VEH07333.1 leucine-rich repeat-containing protein [Legionella pneumophila subsp. pascullei]